MTVRSCDQVSSQCFTSVHLTVIIAIVYFVYFKYLLRDTVTADPLVLRGRVSQRDATAAPITVIRPVQSKKTNSSLHCDQTTLTAGNVSC